LPKVIGGRAVRDRRKRAFVYALLAVAGARIHGRIGSAFNRNVFGAVGSFGDPCSMLEDKALKP